MYQFLLGTFVNRSELFFCIKDWLADWLTDIHTQKLIITTNNLPTVGFAFLVSVLRTNNIRPASLHESILVKCSLNPRVYFSLQSLLCSVTIILYTLIVLSAWWESLLVFKLDWVAYYSYIASILLTVMLYIQPLYAWQVCHRQTGVLGEPKYGPGSEPQWKAGRNRYPAFYKALLKEPSRTKQREMLVADQRSTRTQ